MDYETENRKPRAVMVAVQTGMEENFLHDLDEMEELIGACDMEVSRILIQNLTTPNPGTYIGSGKIEELAAVVEETESDYVIFLDNLSPAQLKNLQEEIPAQILDRTSLILEIFSRRAKTREARLQVELANLQYMLPRLVGMRAALGRQGGASGSMSNKGSGEKQIELDRRRIEHRITELRRNLEDVDHDRQVQRKAREKGNLPRVALVGYTNAGKSTLMNKLVELSGGEEEKLVFEKDMLFATLDTTVRKISTGDKKDFLLSDTVGFINHLPHGLVKAFRSTLDEARYAQLLLIVVDVSDMHHREQLKVTETTLKELDADKIPRIYVYNKADKLQANRYPRIEDDKIYISAGNGEGLKELLAFIKQRVYGENRVISLLLPYSEGSLLGEINGKATVLKQDYTEDGVYMEVDCPSWLVGKVEGFVCPAR